MSLDSKKPRLVHIISGMHHGGAETVLLLLLEQLRTRFDQTVIFFHDGPLKNPLIALSIPFYHLQYRGTFLNPLLTLKLYRLVSHIQPQVIHTSLWAANFIGRICAYFLHIPCISSLHTVTEHEGKLRTVLDSLLPITPTAYVAVSHRVIQSKKNDVKKCPMILIHNGIDIAAVQQSSSPLSDALKIKLHGAFIIGTVGRLVSVKNYPFLLHAFARLITPIPHAHLIIIGSGPDEKLLRALITQLHLHNAVTLLTNQHAHPFYPLFNCFVQPSLHEGLSIALLEALACKIPVLVSGIDETHEIIIHKKNGLIFNPYHSLELSNYIQYVATHSADCATYAHEGYLLASTNHSHAAMANKYANLFMQDTNRSVQKHPFDQTPAG